METLLIGLWVFLTIIIEIIYHKYVRVVYFDISRGILQELIASGLAALFILIFTLYFLFKYISIIIPIVILIVFGLIYKKQRNNNVIITGIVIAVLSFAGLKYFTKEVDLDKDNSNISKIEEQQTDENSDIDVDNSFNKSDKNDLNSSESDSTIKDNTINKNSNVNAIISDNVKGYINSFVDDVNSGQANLCLNYLVNDGPLYREQVKNIPEISKQFKERVDSIDVKDIKQIADNKYSVQVTENIALSKDNNAFEQKEFHNSYVVSKYGSNYLIESMNINKS
ncbi:TcaA NTF2-like domain-containing protein [Clostridium perfringens]|uniref:TcaA NTF2-like domain-containing protein n=1 Tax=Clostridium perfringens TaxID=1502 RepID=UPI0039E9311E